MRPLNARLANAIERCLALLLIGAVALNFANVIGRYLLGRSIFGADEIQIYALVIIAYVGAIAVSLRDGHLRMDVFVKAAPARWQMVVRLAEWALFAGVCGYVAWYSFLYTSRMRSLGRLSDMSELPVWYFHASVTLAFAAMSLIGFCKLWASLRLLGGAPASLPAETP